MKENPIAIVLGAAAAIFGIVLFGKTIVAILNASLVLSDLVVTVLSFFVNVLALCAAIAGPVVVVMLLGALVVFTFRLLCEQLDGMMGAFGRLFDNMKAQIASSTSQFFPLVLAGVTQVLLLLLSDDFATGRTRIVLTAYLWIATTLLLVATSASGAKRRVGVTAVLLSTALTVGFLFWRYGLNLPGRGREILAAALAKAEALSANDLATVLLIALLMLLLVISAAVQAFTRDDTARAV